MSAKRQFVLWASSALFVMQVYCLMCKIPYVADTSSIDRFTTLSTIGPLSFGYVFGHHGATLVWSTGSGKLPNVSRSEDPELPAEMSRQLKSVPVKVIFEYIVYVCVVAVLVLGPSVLSRLWVSQSVWTTSIRAALVTMVGALILSAPLARGYDASIYTTWAGPGSLSSSGPYFHVTFRHGISVSYRIILETVGVLPAWFLERTHLNAILPDMQWWLFYAVVVGSFYAVAAYSVVCCWLFVTRRWRRNSLGDTGLAGPGT